MPTYKESQKDDNNAHKLKYQTVKGSGLLNVIT